jgi:hypothetical protein
MAMKTKIIQVKYILAYLFITNATLFAQLKIVPTAESGSGYTSITSGGLQYEDPDCIHSSFGQHITIEKDTILNKPVFVFHSHIIEDNDRCEVFDRVRMEIKGGPGTSPLAQHPINTKSYYRWKFFVPSSYTGSSDFNHIFQNKIYGGDDTSLPLITFTLRTSALQIIHSGGKTGSSNGVLAQVSLSAIKGQWVEAYMYQEHGTSGKIEVKLIGMTSKKVLLDYKNNNLLLWRNNAEFSRPKWGIYRLKNSAIKDEKILFTDFCISETTADLCPSDVTGVISIAVDTLTKFFPENNAIDIHLKPMLQWDKKDNAIYNVFFGEDKANLPKISSTNLNYLRTPQLKVNKPYFWFIEAIVQGGQKIKSPIQTFTTGDTTKINGQKWLIYNANDLPHIEAASFMELNTRPTNPLKDTISQDPIVPKNKLYTFHFDGTGNFRYRHRHNAADSAITIVMRTKAINKDIKTFNYLEIRGKGWREKMRMNTSSLKIERSVTESEKGWNQDPAKDFHVIRMTLKGQVCKVYLDEEPQPFLIGKTETPDVNTYIEWGKSASQEVGGIVDYIAIYPNIDASPNHLAALPDSLILSNNAKLSDISINGATITGFKPDKTSYVLNLAEDDPALKIDATPQSKHAIFEINKLPNSGDSLYQIVVNANDKISKNTYNIKVRKVTTSTYEIESQDINIFPNPSSSLFNIEIKNGFNGEVFIKNKLGQLIGKKSFDTITQLDLSSLPNGVYFLYFTSEKYLPFRRSIVKQ